MSEAQGKQTNYLGIGAAVVILAIVVIAVITQAAKPAAVNNIVENTTGTTPTTDTAVAAGTYEDGTYTVVGTYTSPAGPEEIGVTVTLANDVITDVSVEPKATNPVSVAKQADFAANYKTMVVGKKIEDVELGKVSGSSLTPKGFNDALTKIEAEAKS